MVFFGAFDLITTARSDQFGSKEFALFDIANSELYKPHDYLATAQEDAVVMTPRGRSAGQAVASRQYDSRQGDRLVGEIDDINNHLDRLTNLIAGVTKDVRMMEKALDQDYKSMTNMNLYIQAISNKIDELSSVDPDMASKLTNVSYLLIRVNNSLRQLNIGDINKSTVTEFEQISSALKAQLTQIAAQLHSFTNGQARLPRGRVKTPLQYYDAFQKFHGRKIELPTRDHFENDDFSKIDHDVLRDTFIRFRITTPSLQEQLKSITLPTEEASNVDKAFLEQLRTKIGSPKTNEDYNELRKQRRFIELIVLGDRDTTTFTGAIQQYDSLKQWQDVVRLYKMFVSYNEREALYRVGPMAAKANGLLEFQEQAKIVLTDIFKAVKENRGKSNNILASPSPEEVKHIIKELEAIKPFMPTSELTNQVEQYINEFNALE